MAQQKDGGGPITPIHGDMTAEQHQAFMLRVFQYVVAMSPNETLEVDLRNVMDKTKDKTLSVSLDGPKFTAMCLPKFTGL